eukprot:TRINITY_DN65214_c0_g1_i1.p1 TRINITY_DN65214_c0_g1~~TRINITY_DN65214_c0_g1_i1.p1  ORF type:complete len:246 (+),score=83.23 TRINITY_DN65214_c0_g1_i1:189-926(+)
MSEDHGEEQEMRERVREREDGKREETLAGEGKNARKRMRRVSYYANTSVCCLAAIEALQRLQWHEAVRADVVYTGIDEKHGRIDDENDDDGEAKVATQIEFEDDEFEEATEHIVSDKGEDEDTKEEQADHMNDQDGELKIAEQVGSKSEGSDVLEEQTENDNEEDMDAQKLSSDVNEARRPHGGEVGACIEDRNEVLEKLKVFSELLKAGMLQALQRQFSMDITGSQQKRAEQLAEIKVWQNKSD